MKPIEKAAAAICRHYRWSEHSVIGHLEWQPGKVDPRGFTMAAMRARIAVRLETTTPPPPPEEDDMTPEQASQLKALYDQRAVAPWTYKGKLDRDAWAILNSLATQVTAQTAAIQALAAQLGEDVDTAQVVAAVQQAIKDAVIKVDVDVTSAPSA